MLYIFSNNHSSKDNYYRSDKDCYSYNKPKDWEFMKQSGEVLKNVPDTWKAYPDTISGKIDIIKMEYDEFLKTSTEEDMKHELIHLASACLCLWRKLNHIDM